MECIEHSIHSQQKACKKSDDKLETQEHGYQPPFPMTPKECIEHSIHSGIQKHDISLAKKI